VAKARQSEVGYLDLNLVAMFRGPTEQQVGRFDVAMDHSQFVRMLQPTGRLTHYLTRIRHAKRTVTPDHLEGVQAVHKFHDEKGQSVRHACVEGTHNVRVL
jgi:hypothetical protein